MCDGASGVRPDSIAVPVRQEAVRVHRVWESGHQAGADVKHSTQRLSNKLTVRVKNLWNKYSSWNNW